MPAVPIAVMRQFKIDRLDESEGGLLASFRNDGLCRACGTKSDEPVLLEGFNSREWDGFWRRCRAEVQATQPLNNALVVKRKPSQSVLQESLAAQ